MFLYCGVQAMQAGAEAVTRSAGDDNVLIVYRKDRYCPFASQMPQSYEQRIAGIAGVESVVPMRIVVSNCRTSLDVVTFRGLPEASFAGEHGRRPNLLSGSLSDWQSRSDAVLLGETLALRRGLKVGDRFSAAGITVYVAGVLRSDHPQEQNVAYAHLSFIQFASGSRAGGVVTQFNVRVRDPVEMERVAEAIDAEFAADAEPTHTRPEKAFVAQAAGDVLEIVAFTRWLGLGCLAAVLALVANAILLAVQHRVREHAVLATLGYRGGLIARLVVSEGLLLSVVGGGVGALMALAVVRWGRFSLSVEGLSVPVLFPPQVLAWGMVICVAVGILAGLVPGWMAARRSIVECFRAV